MHETHTFEPSEDIHLGDLDDNWSDAGASVPAPVRTRRMRGSILVFGALVAGAALAGSVAKPGLFYRLLRKPRFQPPSWVFAPVWTGLYGLIAASGDRVYKAPASPERTQALALWGGQLVLNAAWSPIFFGAKRPRLALVDIAALFVTIGAYAAVARKVDAKAAAMFMPYGGWVGFAAILNASIVKNNRWLELAR